MARFYLAGGKAASIWQQAGPDLGVDQALHVTLMRWSAFWGYAGLMGLSPAQVAHDALQAGRLHLVHFPRALDRQHDPVGVPVVSVIGVVEGRHPKFRTGEREA